MSVQVLATPAVSAENPFPGLRPFEVAESERFFGRDDDIFELLDRLRNMRFLAVVGASGCGKSSLIRAGLVASLSEGTLPGNWRIAVLRPWQSPVAQLAAALGAGGALDVPANSRQEATAIVKAILQRGSLGIVEALQLYPLPPDDRLLILVDQFEELFTFMNDPAIKGAQDDARAFVKLLLEALCPKHGDLPVCIALTMRSDYLGNCALFPGLADAINNGLYLLPQMDREQLRDAIRGPVDVCGGKISERLVDTLINDLNDDTDQLPVLQHAMMRLWGEWQRRDGQKIDFEDYRQIGEMNASLGNHAQEVYASLDGAQHYESLDGPRQQIAEAVFRSITRVDDGKIVRRQTALGLIRMAAKLRDVEAAEVISVIDEFRQDGRSFLVPPPHEPLDDDTVIDISHESLIRQWATLRKWAEDEATKREIYRQLADAARVWAKREESDRDESFLFGGKRLMEADAWLKDNPGLLTVVENDFLAASQDAYEGGLRERSKNDLSERVTAEGATRAEAIEKELAHVFLSYSRRDRPFAERLRAAFAEAGQETLVNWDILLTEGSEEHLLAAIEAADTFVFIISPHSMESERCRGELRHAISRNKRIVPVMLHNVDEWKLPDQLRSSFWVRFTGKEDFDASFRTLREAINTDLYWVQAHSRLLVRAADWDKRGRDVNLLLRGHDLAEAEQWLGKENLTPALTALQRQYIFDSRGSVTKRRRWLSTVAMITGLLLILTATAVYAAFAAKKQAAKAEAAEIAANIQRLEAERQSARADEQRGIAEEAARIASEQRQQAEYERETAKRAVLEAEKQKREAEKQRQLALRLAERERRLRREKEESNRLTGEAARISGEFFQSIYGPLSYDPSVSPTPTPVSPEEEAERYLRNFNDMADIYVRLGFNKPAYVLLNLIQEEIETAKGLDPKLVESVLRNYIKALRAAGEEKKGAEAEQRLRDFLSGVKRPSRFEQKK